MKPDELRELYRGGRPNERAKSIQRRLMPIARLGLVPFSAVLEVTGRRSGRPIQLPIVVLTVAGSRYVVSMLGPTVNWVRNVEAADGKAVVMRGRRRYVRLVRVAPGEAAPVLRRYLRIARSGRVHMDLTSTSTDQELAAAADRYPVFRIDPAPAG
ncbi:MAG: nitroreductase family deazaflavin-dependent oxidoreductase [Actinomycetales bacterium]|jgi:deazaflavin-dependent oxidoreductase (nitroreductase family)|nr:nitroreductase family deazaflavin-dependent oxidoreductase [Candidatus Phosphoribacter baldrii]